MTFAYPSFLRALIALILITQGSALLASEGEEAQEVVYAEAKDAPRQQSKKEADEKSKGCLTCHTSTDKMSMHDNEAVTLGCTDCHGGNASIMVPHAIAKHSGGACFARGEGDKWLKQLPKVSRLTEREVVTDVWNHPLAAILLLACLCAEWWLRRSRGLA